MIFGINTTRLTAREITYNNFEILLVVFMPNITTIMLLPIQIWILLVQQFNVIMTSNYVIVSMKFCLDVGNDVYITPPLLQPLPASQDAKKKKSKGKKKNGLKRVKAVGLQRCSKTCLTHDYKPAGHFLIHFSKNKIIYYFFTEF